MIPLSLGLLLGLAALAIPVAAVLALLALTLSEAFSRLPLHRALGEIAWSTTTDFLLVAIPLFILLGEILLRAGIAARMYDALALFLGRLPGGLMHSNIASCALFAATSGSSVATAATVGTVAEPQIAKHGYDSRLFLGTLAAGGTLGILIPPSINMIIYGVLTDTSIPRLFMAGIVPGLLLAGLFMLLVLGACLLWPALDGRRDEAVRISRLRALLDLLPPAFIFLVVLGSIYGGWATPTEAASLGVLGALLLAALKRRLNFAMLASAIEGTVRTTAMVMLIIVAAYFLNFVMASVGLTDRLSGAITGLGWSPYAMLAVVIVFYVVLGFFMETLSMMITTIPIIAPVMFALGFDPVWFGVLLMLLVETALITPPIGLNLFVVQGIRTTNGPMSDVVSGTLPFVLAMFVMIGLLVAFPGLALWLPGVLG